MSLSAPVKQDHEFSVEHTVAIWCSTRWQYGGLKVTLVLALVQTIWNFGFQLDSDQAKQYCIFITWSHPWEFFNFG